MPSSYEHILAKPVEVVVACDCAVRELTVSRDEPEWSLNFKKALVVLFQSTVDTYSIELEQNRVSLISILRSLIRYNLQNKNFSEWTVVSYFILS